MSCVPWKLVNAGSSGVAARRICGLAVEAFEVHVRHEPVVVELQALDALLADRARWLDLVPGRVDVAPERRHPGSVHAVKRAVARLEPLPEACRAAVAVAIRPVLVADVPHAERRVRAVSLGQPSHQVLPEAPEVGARRAEVHAVAVASPMSLRIDRQHVRIGARQPRRLGGGRRAEAGADAAIREQVHHAVEPFESVPILGRLKGRPGEDARAGDVHPGFLHEPDVFAPDGLLLVAHRGTPLLGVPVAAVEEAAAPHRRAGGPSRRADLLFSHRSSPQPRTAPNERPFCQ